MAAGIKVKNIEQLRAQYLRGDSTAALAAEFGCHPITVARYCRDLERPEPPKPLTAEVIDSMIRKWGRGCATF